MRFSGKGVVADENILPSTAAFEIKRVRGAESERAMDTIAVEEPLDIRIQYRFKDAVRVQSLALTMRTPGFDRELSAGLLLSEGIIARREDLVELRALGAEPQNEMIAELAGHVDVDAWRLGRDSVMNSSCGVCGKRSREAMAVPEYAAGENRLRVSPDLLRRLPALLEEQQHGFNRTGGLHAAALVNGAGQMEAVYEDIGRHNALDKLIGHCVLQGRVPLAEHLLFLSSRSSFELVQKTVMAGCRMLVTVGGPSSLAVEMAREHGVTLVGFLREQRFNIYSGDWRID